MDVTEELRYIRKTKIITLQNPIGMTKRINLKFDWLYFFLSIIAAPVKGYWKQSFIGVGIESLVTFLLLIGLGAVFSSHLKNTFIFLIYILPLVYRVWWSSVISKRYIKQLLLDGWLPATEEDSQYMKNYGIYNS